MLLLWFLYIWKCIKVPASNALRVKYTLVMFFVPDILDSHYRIYKKYIRWKILRRVFNNNNVEGISPRKFIQACLFADTFEQRPIRTYTICIVHTVIKFFTLHTAYGASSIFTFYNFNTHWVVNNFHLNFIVQS